MSFCCSQNPILTKLLGLPHSKVLEKDSPKMDTRSKPLSSAIFGASKAWALPTWQFIVEAHPIQSLHAPPPTGRGRCETVSCPPSPALQRPGDCTWVNPSQQNCPSRICGSRGVSAASHHGKKRASSVLDLLAPPAREP